MKTITKKLCEHCSKEFIVGYNWKAQRFCNRQCSAKARKNRPSPYTVKTNCKCDCGGVIMNPDSHYRDRKFIKGHTNRNGTHPRIGFKESDEHIKFRLSSIHKHFRNNYTCLEKKLYQFLDNTGITYEKQKQIGRTRPDAFIPSLNLCIYADGSFWHSKTKDKERDKNGEDYLKKNDYLFIRLHDLNYGYDLNLEPLQEFFLTKNHNN